MKTLGFAGLTHFCLLPHKSLAYCVQKKQSPPIQCISALHLSSKWKTQWMKHEPWPRFGAGPMLGLPYFRRGVTIPCPLFTQVLKSGETMQRFKTWSYDNSSPIKNHFPSFYEVGKTEIIPVRRIVFEMFLGVRGCWFYPYQTTIFLSPPLFSLSLPQDFNRNSLYQYGDATYVCK